MVKLGFKAQGPNGPGSPMPYTLNNIKFTKEKKKKKKLGSKDLGLNIQNHICIMLANREQNMSSLGFQATLKGGCFKVQVQLIVEKGSGVLPFLTDRELGPIHQKSHAQFSTKF